MVSKMSWKLYRKYGEKELDEAVLEVRKDLTVRSVTRTTLWDHATGKIKPRAKSGNPPTLSFEVENQKEAELVNGSKKGFGVTKSQVLAKTGKIAKTVMGNIPFKNGTPGQTSAVDKEPNQLACARCGFIFPSAWLLCRHFQEEHNTDIYLPVDQARDERCVSETCSERSDGESRHESVMSESGQSIIPEPFKTEYSDPHCEADFQGPSASLTDPTEAYLPMPETIEVKKEVVSDKKDDYVCDNLSTKDSDRITAGYMCTFCDKIFLHLSALDQHSKVHNSFNESAPTPKSNGALLNALMDPDDPNKSNQRSSPSLVVQGPVALPKVNMLPCEYCGDYIHQYHLENHLAGHLGRERSTFHCDQCGHNFDRKKELLDHYSTNDCVRFKCRECGKKVKNNYCLERHMLVCSTIVNCTFPDCDKQFKQQSSLDLHKANYHGVLQDSYPGTDESDEPVACDICGKHFKNYYMKIHKQLQHSGTAPILKCENCNRAYIRMSPFKRHRERCSTRSVPPHKKAKNDDIVLYCTLCSETYNDYANFNVHMANEHGVMADDSSVTVKSDGLCYCEHCGKYFNECDFEEHDVKSQTCFGASIQGVTRVKEEPVGDLIKDQFISEFK